MDPILSVNFTMHNPDTTLSQHMVPAGPCLLASGRRKTGMVLELLIQYLSDKLIKRVTVH